MSLQHELFIIANSVDKPKPVSPMKLPKGYTELTESDKLVCEDLLKTCYSSAYLGEKFIKIPEKVSQDVLFILGIPEKTVFFYWDTPGIE